MSFIPWISSYRFSTIFPTVICCRFCSSPSTFSTRRPNPSVKSANWSAWYSTPTPTSWTLNAQVCWWFSSILQVLASCGKFLTESRVEIDLFRPGKTSYCTRVLLWVYLRFFLRWFHPFKLKTIKRFLFPLGCYKITTVFSHAQTVVCCVGCSQVLCQPSGGKARLTEGTKILFDFLANQSINLSTALTQFSPINQSINRLHWLYDILILCFSSL